MLSLLETLDWFPSFVRQETVAGEGQWYFMSDLRKMKAGVDDPKPEFASGIFKSQLNQLVVCVTFGV